jgi:hypothetical protein
MANDTSRLETAIERLTEISSDLSKMVAVHEHRISQQEKASESLSDTIEKRREEFDTKLGDVYNTMREQDNEILNQIVDMKKENAEQFKKLNEKISQMEKYIWMAIGGAFTVSLILSYSAQFFTKLIK